MPSSLVDKRTAFLGGICHFHVKVDYISLILLSTLKMKAAGAEKFTFN
jgi:hypothetical protein